MLVLQHMVKFRLVKMLQNKQKQFFNFSSASHGNITKHGVSIFKKLLNQTSPGFAMAGLYRSFLYLGWGLCDFASSLPFVSREFFFSFFGGPGPSGAGRPNKIHLDAGVYAILAGTAASLFASDGWRP